MAKTLIVGSDHAGFALKKELCDVARELGYEIEDVGTHSTGSTDYPDYSHQVAKAVSCGEGLGLLVCGTGVGMSMAANRHPGVRAAACGDIYTAAMARRHNDANVLCLGARVIGPGLAAEILKAFLSSSFEGGRHERRVHKIELPDES
ncbi:MAG: ribose 5-phosphate isomerase B [Myxococcales bacterium]|nr:ribose 5-phosphate isomerase B [Myxococcales bacterium]MDH3484200.1 ribose 5-phosphate isomerase B [Myxococcales bacterium]